MRSKTARRIHDETPQEIKDKVKEYGDTQVKAHQTMTDQQKSVNDFILEFEKNLKSKFQTKLDSQITTGIPVGYATPSFSYDEIIELFHTTLPTKE